MKAPPFGYHRASSVADAVQLLSMYDGAARVLSGGQSLMPMLGMRLIRPDALIDVNDLTELTGIHSSGHEVRVGALVRCSAIEASAVIADRLPLLRRVVRHIGDRQVRNRGTIGGSLAHGDPTAEMPLACLTLEAVVRVVGPSGSREIPMRELYETSYATTLDPCEILTEISFLARPAYAAFAESCRRHNDFAVISVAAVGDRNPDDTWSGVRIGLGGVADTPVLAEPAMALLENAALTPENVAAAAEAIAPVLDPPSDVRASAEYRRHLAPIYVRRVLRDLATAGSITEGLIA